MTFFLPAETAEDCLKWVPALLYYEEIEALSYDIIPAPFLPRFDDAVNSNPFKSLFDQPSFILPHSVKDHFDYFGFGPFVKEGFEKEAGGVDKINCHGGLHFPKYFAVAAKEGFGLFINEAAKEGLEPLVKTLDVQEIPISFYSEKFGGVDKINCHRGLHFPKYFAVAAKEGFEHFINEAAEEGLEPLVKTLDVQEIPISFYSEKFGGVDKINCHGGLHFPNYLAVAA